MRRPDHPWLPAPPAGTSVCGGFDGSENNDWTAIKLETRSGLIFTPRYGPDRRPTYWNPAEWGGRIPREQVSVAWGEIVDTYEVGRVYCDPGFRDESSWETEIEEWASEHGEKVRPGHGDEVFVPWVMSGSTRIAAVFAALKRFESDLQQRRIRHDGCPVTTTHMGNARKIARSADRYILGKPSLEQKIDLAVTSVLAHEAACDNRAAGWVDPGPTYFRLPR